MEGISYFPSPEQNVNRAWLSSQGGNFRLTRLRISLRPPKRKQETNTHHTQKMASIKHEMVVELNIIAIR